MRRGILAFAVAVGLVAIDAGPAEVAAQNARTKIDFVQNGIGVPPADFEFWRGGSGSPGDWAVVRDHTASAGAAIEQSSRDATENRYPLAIYKPVSLKNVEVSASIKMISGTTWTAGIAVRLIDAGNYYAVAANALEGRVDLYRFSGGKRERIAGTEADIARDHWQTLRVIIEGDHMTVSLDEQLLFKAWDRLFLKEGHVALWTEEDTTARFDRIEITDHPWIHDEHARWSIGAILTPAAEGADVDAFRTAMDSVGPRVAGLLEHLLGLDDLVDFCLGGIRLRIHNINTRGAEPGDN